MLGRKGTYDRTLGRFYLVILKAVLLFGTDTWVLTPFIARLLGGFHNRVAQWITGNKSRRRSDRRWDYPPLEEAMQSAGLE